MQSRLVVADEAREFLQEVLSILAVEFNVVATAADGKEALERINFHQPDAAILDYHLPKLSGLDAARYLARHPPSPPVVICSVETHPLIINTVRRAGALGYVFKTSVQRDLVRAVKIALRGRSFRSYASLGRVATATQACEEMIQTITQPMRFERRRCWRHVFGGVVELSTIPAQTLIIASTVDICRLGCFVQTRAFIPVGTQVRLKISYDENQLTAVGEVVHMLSGRGVGIKLTGVASEDEALLEVWLR